MGVCFILHVSSVSHLICLLVFVPFVRVILIMLLFGRKGIPYVERLAQEQGEGAGVFLHKKVR